jgi:hypothetical protein
MAGDIEKKQIQDELNAAGVSRRGFIDRIKGLGLGFGVAATLGVEGASAHPASDASVNLSSTNPALNSIINEADKQESGEKKVKEAWFRRFFYRRFFYARGYRRFFYRRF